MIGGTENGVHRYWNMRDSSGSNLHIHSSTKKACVFERKMGKKMSESVYTDFQNIF